MRHFLFTVLILLGLAASVTAQKQGSPFAVSRDVYFAAFDGQKVVTVVEAGEVFLLVQEEWDAATVTTTVPYQDIFALDYPVQRGGAWVIKITARTWRTFDQRRQGDMAGLPYGKKPSGVCTLYFSSREEAVAAADGIWEWARAWPRK